MASPSENHLSDGGGLGPLVQQLVSPHYDWSMAAATLPSQPPTPRSRKVEDSDQALAMTSHKSMCSRG